MANRRPPQHISFLLAALALTAFLDAHALVPVPAAMATPTTAGVEGLYETLEKDRLLEEIFHKAAHVTYEVLEDLLPSLGDGSGESGGTAEADAIRSIGTGRQTFSVATVDITAPLTWTTRCDAGGGRPVPCISQACTTMAPVQTRCALYSLQFPPCSYGTSTVLYEADYPITVEDSSGRRLNNQAQQVYPCQNYQPPSSMAAVLGLGWSGVQSLGLQRFSYFVASNRAISVSVPVGGSAAAVARRGSSSTGTATLLYNSKYPDPYYVSVTGINVGGDEVLPAGALDLRHDGSGGVFLSTIMPFTLLETNVYASLINKLNAQLPQKSITSSSLNTKQLCYKSGTWTPPRITLVLGGGATMKLRVENCWYKKTQDNSVCLAILPSPWTTGESVLGTMMQSGWRMTYDLSARTLTFQSSSSATIFRNSLLLLLMSFLTMFLNMQVS